MVVTNAMIATLVSALHLDKAQQPMVVTNAGIATPFSPLHPKKARAPMVVAQRLATAWRSGDCGRLPTPTMTLCAMR